METGPSSFSLSRVMSGWWWLLNRDGLRLIQFAMFWVLVKFGLYALDHMLGLNQGLGLLSTTLLLDPFFFGVFYLVALGDEGWGPMQVQGEASRRYLALLGVSVLSNAGIARGFVLLIVPGLALTVLWSVAIPALLAENKGPIDALKSSYNLVRRNFWSVVGAFFVYVVGVSAVTVLLLFTGLSSDDGAPGPLLALAAVIEVISSIIGIYLATAIYRELAFRDRLDVGVFD